MTRASNLKKDYLWNTVGTSANSFISLLLLVAVTRINGIAESGIFSFCFGYAVLFFTIGLYGGRIYQVSDLRGEFESRTYIFLKLLTSGAMLISALVFILANDYDQERVALLLSLSIYKLLDAVSDPLYGVMQRKNHLYYAGISMTLKAVTGFAAFVILDMFTKNILLSSISLLAANVLFIVVYDIPHTTKLEKIGGLFHMTIRPGLRLLRISGFIFAFSLLTNLLVNIPRYFVDAHHDADALGWFGIIIMPASMLNLFVQFVIQPKLVPLSERFAEKAYPVFNATVTKLIFISLGFGAAAILLAWFIGCPVLSWVYAKDISPYRTGLTLVVLAGTINTVTMIYSNMLSIMRRFKIQLLNYLIATAAIFAASMALVTKGGVNGALLAFTIANAVQAALFFVSYQLVFRKLRNHAEICSGNFPSDS